MSTTSATTVAARSGKDTTGAAVSSGERRPPSPPVRRRGGAAGGSTLLAHGEPLVWLTGGALVLCLAMIAGLLGLIVHQGLGSFRVRPVEARPSSAARCTRWASPPERVVLDWPSVM